MHDGAFSIHLGVRLFGTAQSQYYKNPPIDHSTKQETSSHSIIMCIVLKNLTKMRFEGIFLLNGFLVRWRQSI